MEEGVKMSKIEWRHLFTTPFEYINKILRLCKLLNKFGLVCNENWFLKSEEEWICSVDAAIFEKVLDEQVGDGADGESHVVGVRGAGQVATNLRS